MIIILKIIIVRKSNGSVQEDGEMTYEEKLKLLQTIDDDDESKWEGLYTY